MRSRMWDIGTAQCKDGRPAGKWRQSGLVLLAVLRATLILGLVAASTMTTGRGDLNSSRNLLAHNQANIGGRRPR